MKQCPASDSRIKIANPDVGVETSELKKEANPYDEFAVEEALKLKDAGVASEVVVFTIGGKGAEQTMRMALALGADRAVRLEDPAFEGSDSLGVARILTAALKAQGVGLVLGGKQAIDDDNAQVLPMVAELLGWPQLMVISKLEFEGETVRGWRAAGGGIQDVIEARLPAVIGCDKGLNQPRYPKLPQIVKAKRKPIDVVDAASLGIPADQVGTSGAKVTNGAWALPPARPAGRILEGDNHAVVKELVQLLRNEAKVL
ncbi:MAG: electron transfer flavoprotein subunit beta/FixA family protein [Myxococcota bacterium]|nr:electron transfer flavoprotein subunit beta/FixA family protein [Myxococcota bacterium]